MPATSFIKTHRDSWTVHLNIPKTFKSKRAQGTYHLVVAGGLYGYAEERAHAPLLEVCLSLRSGRLRHLSVSRANTPTNT